MSGIRIHAIGAAVSHPLRPAAATRAPRRLRVDRERAAAVAAALAEGAGDAVMLVLALAPAAAGAALLLASFGFIRM